MSPVWPPKCLVLDLRHHCSDEREGGCASLLSSIWAHGGHILSCAPHTSGGHLLCPPPRLGLPSAPLGPVHSPCNLQPTHTDDPPKGVGGQLPVSSRQEKQEDHRAHLPHSIPSLPQRAKNTGDRKQRSDSWTCAATSHRTLSHQETPAKPLISTSSTWVEAETPLLGAGALAKCLHLGTEGGPAKSRPQSPSLAQERCQPSPHGAGFYTLAPQRR